MKTIINMILILILLTGLAHSQSNLTIESGAMTEIGAGASICADIQTGDGILTGEGTWCEGVLPVELISFLSDISGNSVTLRWTTAMEVNNAGFEIHRSVSSEHPHWNTVGYVTGIGNSSQPVNYSFTDNGLTTGNYMYRLKQIDFNGIHEYYLLDNEISIGSPLRFSLSQNYPNPFNPETKISFSIPEESYVSMRVFNSAGKQVSVMLHEMKTSGSYEISFNGKDLPSGIYFYVLKADSQAQKKSFRAVKKMILVK